MLSLVQNADDAGAQTVKFCFDERHHGAGDSLPVFDFLILAPCKFANLSYGASALC